MDRARQNLATVTAIAVAVGFLSRTVALTGLAAQVAQIVVQSSRPISTNLTPHAETFAALNPVDSQNLLATSLVSGDSPVRSTVYASLDGGRTWRQSRFADGDVIANGGDPIVYFDRTGAAWFGTIQ